MAGNGEEKLIAVARHIAKTLGHTESMTDDIIKIFSNFDGRLREKLSDDAMEQTLNSIERSISRHASDNSSIWVNSHDSSSSSFLDSVDRLIASVREWSPFAEDKNISSCLDRAKDLLQQCMLRLEDEFKTLVQLSASGSTHHPHYSDGVEENDSSVENDENFVPVAKPVTHYDVVFDPMPEATIKDFHEIAKRMVAAGYVKECSNAYTSYRREFLEKSFSRLGLHKFTIDEVQKMQWTQLEDEIEKWIKTMNVALRVLFPSEQRLCDRVFFGFSSAADQAFMEICKGSTTQLLDFADAVAIASRSPERLFKVLDVYETVRDLMPEFELIFSDEHCLNLRNEAITILKRLGEVIRGIFMELENLICRDSVKSAVPGGGLHPITRYVINYLRAVCRSRQTLEEVFNGSNLDYTKVDGSPFPSSLLVVQITWIMELLESNLEAKSKVYRDVALSSVFMMNNRRYIVQKVKDNELGTLLGDDWIRKHMAKVRQHHLSYQRSSWTKVLSVLKIDTNSISSNGASKNLREKLKLFNSYFEDICKSQSSWVIFDEQLREELRISVSGTLSPAYRNFIGRLQIVPDIGKHVRYSVEDLDARIIQLFKGNAAGRR